MVVPAHNAQATLGAQLEALATQVVRRPFEVIVVDNQSTDATAQVAHGFADRFAHLRVVTASAGAGVAYARNFGTALASGDRVVYCQADDIVRPGWLQAMSVALDSADLVGGVLDVRQINSAYVQSLSWHPTMTELPTTMRYLAYATGASLGVRLSVWRELNGFDETFIGGHEEVDFAWRAQLAGHTIGFAPEAVIDYRLRGSVKGVMKQRYGYGRSYAQLYSRFTDQPIRRLSLKHEVKVIGTFLISGPRECLAGRGNQWLAGLAWTAGRWRGNFAYGVRCPL